LIQQSNAINIQQLFLLLPVHLLNAFLAIRSKESEVRRPCIQIQSAELTSLSG